MTAPALLRLTCGYRSHRTTGSDELIGRVPCEARRSETRSNVFLSRAAQSGSRTDRIFPDTRTRSRARSLRSCAPHTLVSALSRRAADADRETGPARGRPGPAGGRTRIASRARLESDRPIRAPEAAWCPQSQIGIVGQFHRSFPRPL